VLLDLMEKTEKMVHVDLEVTLEQLVLQEKMVWTEKMVPEDQEVILEQLVQKEIKEFKD